MFTITTERPDEAGVIELLLDTCFGPNRFDKSSYGFRVDVAPDRRLCLVARAPDDSVVGTIRYWPIVIGMAAAPALLLGPLAVAESHRKAGVGAALMRTSLDMAAWSGDRLVVLVGDIAYYRRFGFTHATDLALVMPGETPERVLARSLRGDLPTDYRGLIQPRRLVRRLTGGDGLAAAA
ncbi:MAG TPA: N-acetyltransferase [Stellaceae bacterium]|nr:N-acetyltransferase [Stellaceae bacterium]